jgi:hypothetical protein
MVAQVGGAKFQEVVCNEDSPLHKNCGIFSSYLNLMAIPQELMVNPRDLIVLPRV